MFSLSLFSRSLNGMDAWKLFCCTLGVSICVVCLFTCWEVDWLEGAGPSVQIGDRNHFVPPANGPLISSWPECRTALFLDAHIHTQYTQTKTELNCKDTDKIVHVQVSRYPPALAKYGRHKKMKNNWIIFFLLMVTRISSFWEPDIVNRGGRGKERGAIALEAHTLLVQKNGKYHRSIGSTRISAQGTNCVRSSLVLVVELVFPTACSDHGTPRLCLDPLLCRLVTLSPTLRPLDRKTKKPS